MRGESSWYQREKCRRKGRHWVANTVEVMAEGEDSAKACSSYLNVEWRALRPVMADGPERGRTIFPRHVVLLTEIMPRRPISSETTLGCLQTGSSYSLPPRPETSSFFRRRLACPNTTPGSRPLLEARSTWWHSLLASGINAKNAVVFNQDEVNWVASDW